MLIQLIEQEILANEAWAASKAGQEYLVTCSKAIFEKLQDEFAILIKNIDVQTSHPYKKGVIISRYVYGSGASIKLEQTIETGYKIDKI